MTDGPEPTYPEPTNYVRNDATSLTPDQERTWALTAHAIAGAAMVLSAGTLGFVAALVIYLVYKDRGPFVRQHAADAVNIQLNALIWFIVGGILALVLIGFAVLAAVPVVAVVLHIIGAVKAYAGDWHWSPLTIRFVK
jgi:uncharacterized Tic20 family protein